MPLELIESIIEKKSDVIISQAEEVCSKSLDELSSILQELKKKLPHSMYPVLVELEDAYINVCIESSKCSYKSGLIDGMKIYNFCNK